MKKLFLIIVSSASLIAASKAEAYRPSRPEANWTENDLTPSIPVINAEIPGYNKIPDVMFKGEAADWNNVIGMAKRVSLEEAAKIADSNPEISFFFYTKSGMVIEYENGYRHFNYGDAIFFSGTPTWGSAQNLADGYIKITD